MRFALCCVFLILKIQALQDFSQISSMAVPRLTSELLRNPAFGSDCVVSKADRTWKFCMTGTLSPSNHRTIERIPGLYGFYSGESTIGGQKIQIPAVMNSCFFGIYRVTDQLSSAYISAYIFVYTPPLQKTKDPDLDLILKTRIPRDAKIKLFNMMHSLSGAPASPTIGHARGNLTLEQNRRIHMLGSIGQGARSLQRNLVVRELQPMNVESILQGQWPAWSAIVAGGQEYTVYGDLPSATESIISLPGVYFGGKGPFYIGCVLVNSTTVPEDYLYKIYLITSRLTTRVLTVATLPQDSEVDLIFLNSLSNAEKVKLAAVWGNAPSIPSVPAPNKPQPPSGKFSKEASVQGTLASFSSIGSDPLQNSSYIARLNYLEQCFGLLSIPYDLAEIQSLANGIFPLSFYERIHFLGGSMGANLDLMLSEFNWVTEVSADGFKGDELPQALELLGNQITEIRCDGTSIKTLPLGLLKCFPHLKVVSFKNAAHLNNVSDINQGWLNSARNFSVIYESLIGFIHAKPTLVVFDLKGTGLEANFQTYINHNLTHNKDPQTQGRLIKNHT